MTSLIVHSHYLACSRLLSTAKGLCVCTEEEEEEEEDDISWVAQAEEIDLTISEWGSRSGGESQELETSARL